MSQPNLSQVGISMHSESISPIHHRPIGSATFRLSRIALRQIGSMDRGSPARRHRPYLNLHRRGDHALRSNRCCGDAYLLRIIPAIGGSFIFPPMQRFHVGQRNLQLGFRTGLLVPNPLKSPWQREVSARGKEMLTEVRLRACC